MIINLKSTHKQILLTEELFFFIQNLIYKISNEYSKKSEQHTKNNLKSKNYNQTSRPIMEGLSMYKYNHIYTLEVNTIC